MNGAMGGPMRRAIFWRTLLLQACWSFERMQSTGLAFCLEPWLTLRYGRRPAELKEARLRQHEFFNTQPYMASLVIGMICALEEGISCCPEAERPDRITRLQGLKKAAASALAGLGDAFFWGALRPFCAALSLTIALALWPRGPELALAASALAYLAAHNLPALAVRWGGLSLGYYWKDQIGLRLKDLPCQAVIRGVRLAGTVLALCACAMMLRHIPMEWRLLSAAALAVFFASKRLTGMAPNRLYAATCAAAALAAAAGGLS